MEKELKRKVKLDFDTKKRICHIHIYICIYYELILMFDCFDDTKWS